jgi:hypothetical protein
MVIELIQASLALRQSLRDLDLDAHPGETCAFVAEEMARVEGVCSRACDGRRTSGRLWRARGKGLQQRGRVGRRHDW